MRSMTRLLVEGRPSRSSGCAVPAGPPDGATSARIRWVSRPRRPHRILVRRDGAVPQNGAARSATAARGTSVTSDESVRPSAPARGAFGKSQSTRASPQVSSQGLDELGEAHPARPTRQFPDPHLETLQRRRRDVPLAPIVRDAKAQKRSVRRLSHRTLGLVDFQPKLRGQESAHTGHDPVARSTAADVDVAIVRVATESVTAAFQFLVEFIEH